jgi:aspartyl-tRNA(Asn)/glutamyl-tRNA(Gln) amidotransferase subunit A
LNTTGIVPLAPTLDHPGPIARTVLDLSLLWDALSEPLAGSSNDTGACRIPVRLGRLLGAFAERAEPSAREAMERFLARCVDAGASVTEVALPPAFADVWRWHRTIMASEAAAWHERLLEQDPDAYPPRIRELVQEGLATPASQYVRAREHREALRREILDCFQGLDALATPAALGPAPDASTTGDPAFNSPWSYTGLPTISFPISLAPDGLPLAIQLVGRPLDERGLAATALWCQNLVNPA